MSGVRLLQNVIETRLERRGDGTEKNPVRIVTQYWDEHGSFLAERDDFEALNDVLAPFMAAPRQSTGQDDER